MIFVLIVLTGVVSCARDEGAVERPSRVARKVATSPAKNPFAADEGPGEVVSRCVRATLFLERSGASLARAVLNVRNDCSTAAAVLTAPTEVRVRRRTSDRFPEQSSLTRAYVTFYVAPRTVGLSSEMFFGDGGYLVYVPPAYTAVPANGSVAVPIRSADRLLIDTAPGEAVMTVFTSVVPMAVYEPSASPIDLTVDVAAYNKQHKGGRTEPFRLSRRAHEISATLVY